MAGSKLSLARWSASAVLAAATTLLMLQQTHAQDGVCKSCYIIQVEKTLEMWSRNGKVIKQGRNVYDVLAM